MSSKPLPEFPKWISPKKGFLAMIDAFDLITNGLRANVLAIFDEELRFGFGLNSRAGPCDPRG